MDVVLNAVGEVKVDDCADVGHVEAPGGDVGGAHDGHAAGLEVREDLVPLLLPLVAVDCGGAELARHLVRQLIAHALGRAEHNDARARRLGAQDLGQPRILLLLAAVHDLHKLRDGLVGDCLLLHAADKHVDGPVGHELRRDLLDLARPGGGEEERLALRRNGAHDALDLWLEAHVEHAVRLIQHEVGDLTQLDLARLQEVVETAGRGDHDLHAVLDVPQLRPLGCAAIHTPAVQRVADKIRLYQGKGIKCKKGVDSLRLQTADNQRPR